MKLPAFFLLATMALLGQSWYPRHNLGVDFGGSLPRGDLKNFMVERPVLGVNYGYRFHRYFQADLGLDTVFGAAEVRAFEETALGPLRIRDFQFFVPMGGRAILPLARGRWLFYGGGGGAYLRYSERLRQPSDYFRVACPTCTSRSGWGYYAQAGFSFFMDRGGHFRLGAKTRAYRASTEGEPLGSVPALLTHDRWFHIMAEFGFSF